MKPAKELALAAGQGELAAMRTILSTSPEAAKDWQPLMDASHVGQPEAVELLLDRGADPTTRDASGATPLEAAREKGNAKAVGFLSEVLSS